MRADAEDDVDCHATACELDDLRRALLLPCMNSCTTEAIERCADRTREGRIEDDELNQA